MYFSKQWHFFNKKESQKCNQKPVKSPQRGAYFSKKSLLNKVENHHSGFGNRESELIRDCSMIKNVYLCKRIQHRKKML